MTQRNFIIIGGTSGIGLALARKLVKRGDKVLIGGRDERKLKNTLEQLGANASGHLVDMADRESVKKFFSAANTIDGLFTPGTTYSTGDFKDGNINTSERLFESKFWSQYWAVYEALPHLSENASIVLMSGAASARPIGAPAYAACNAALEGLARGLAVELSPVRVNCLSPGTTDSELWRNRDEKLRKTAYDYWNNATLVKRPGTVDEQADSALFLLDNKNMTGSTLYCDGGYTLR
jgi:NAD(P)-dependent dehydrogenase (short-subunit alcohol dehydrogenase family)